MNLFITNREIYTNPDGSEFIREDGKENAGDNLRFGKYDNKKFLLFDEPSFESDSNYQEILLKEKEELKGSARFFREIYQELIEGNGKKNDVLFFIHGFNTDLNGVRSAFDTLNKKYVDNPNSPIKHIVIFTWPGRSPVVPYHYHDDKKDAIRSGEALARGFEKVVKFFREFLVKGDNIPCNRNINLLVHSMGHRVLKHMMLEMKENHIPFPDLFNEIILIAADIEFDIFEKGESFDKLIELGKRVHIYFHEKDRVLDISKFTKNFSNRLGRYGRKRIDPMQIDVRDANVTKTKDDANVGFGENNLNHWYYYSSTEVVEDIVEVLRGKDSKFTVAK